jgi:hypothetical protein
VYSLVSLNGFLFRYHLNDNDIEFSDKDIVVNLMCRNSMSLITLQTHISLCCVLSCGNAVVSYSSCVVVKASGNFFTVICCLLLTSSFNLSMIYAFILRYYSYCR